jgi:hypothetical protein
VNTRSDLPFLIKATRIKASLDDDKTFYWFYVGIHLEDLPGAQVSLNDVALVEYHMEDPSFLSKDKNKRVSSPANKFEYRIWLYGFIKVSADIITKRGDLIKLPTTKLSWAFTEEEESLNGRDELSWD